MLSRATMHQKGLGWAQQQNEDNTILRILIQQCLKIAGDSLSFCPSGCVPDCFPTYPSCCYKTPLPVPQLAHGVGRDLRRDLPQQTIKNGDYTRPMKQLPALT